MITIIYGPQACGKTRNKTAFADHYGHSHVIDGAYHIKPRLAKFNDDQGKVHAELPDNALVLTNMTSGECVNFASLSKHEVRIITFADALAELGAIS